VTAPDIADLRAHIDKAFSDAIHGVHYYPVIDGGRVPFLACYEGYVIRGEIDTHIRT
jgi:hypothetical protein